MATQVKGGTNAAEMLRADHKKVKELFRQYEEAGDRAYRTKQRLAEEIFQELEVHTRLEEEIFYPAVKATRDKELKEVVDEGLEEHHVADVLIEEIKALSPEDDAFDAKMKVLGENIEHHIEEEEEEMLPDAEKCLGDRVNELGEAMQRRKRELQTA